MWPFYPLGSICLSIKFLTLCFKYEPFISKLSPKFWSVTGKAHLRHIHQIICSVHLWCESLACLVCLTRVTGESSSVASQLAEASSGVVAFLALFCLLTLSIHFLSWCVFISLLHSVISWCFGTSIDLCAI